MSLATRTTGLKNQTTSIPDYRATPPSRLGVWPARLMDYIVYSLSDLHIKHYLLKHKCYILYNPLFSKSVALFNI